MKFKTTVKDIRNGYHKIISIGYCELQSLLSYENPVAYNAGVYGWNFDLYDIDGVAIATGYRGMPEKNSRTDYKIVCEYEKMADGKNAQQKNKLLKEFIAKCTKI